MRPDPQEDGRGVESKALFPGEWQDTTFRADAEHWVEVYEGLIRTAGELAGGGNVSRQALDAAQQRYRRRLEFWRRRLDELTASRG